MAGGRGVVRLCGAGHVFGGAGLTLLVVAVEVLFAGLVAVALSVAFLVILVF